MTSLLKGDAFLNRYRITGKLTTVAPLHIGTGDERQMEFSNDEEKKKIIEKVGKVPRISMIIIDYRGKPLIPGSTLRGVLRNWLLTVLEGIGTQWAIERDYTDDELLGMDQAEQIQRVKETFSRLELLFGTPLNAGKVDVWDATCSTSDLQAMNDKLLGWDDKRLTYVDTSVAIDPARGTAKNKLLYKADVVPPGVTFELNLVAQNLSDEELGLVLLALEGFNSQIYPVQVGARGGRGYGRMKFEMGAVYQLERENVKNWLKETLQAMGTSATPAGYFGLTQLAADEQKTKIKAVKDQLAATIGG
ncbi:MAG: RAMP superfamily CRISPR-associated protein [Methanothrix sp.]|nr:RAMP superfamily CRISPR-associated protein [Methanothrix sp.]